MSTQSAMNVPAGSLPLNKSIQPKWRIPRSAIRLMADRLAPAAFFLLFLSAKGARIPDLLGQLQAAGSLQRWQLLADMANYALVSFFLATVIGIYALRRSAIQKNKGFWQGVTALGATLAPTMLVLIPPSHFGFMAAMVSNTLIAVGLIIAISGIWALRGCFGILPEVRGMVTGGLYRLVRHPIYLGESLASVAVALTVLSPLAAAILIVYFLLQWRRALYEEALLAATFPEYNSYARRTKRFIPFVW